MAELLPVTRWIPELVEVAGAGKTETDAPESTRKFQEERVSLRYRRKKEKQAGRKNFLPASQLVFRPGAGLLTLLGLVSVCPVEPAGGEDGGWRPLMAVRGSWGAGMAGGDGIIYRRVAVLAGSRFGWTEFENWMCRIAGKKV